MQGYKIFKFIAVKLKPKIIVKLFNIILDLLVKNLFVIPINFRQVGIQHHLETTNRVDSGFQEIFVYQGEIVFANCF